MERVEDLLVHEGLVRGVARAVLRGDDRVEDVVQDTWLASMRGGPDRPASARGWLARVSHRFALMVRRGDASRRRRETVAVHPSSVPSAADISEREESRRRVLEALLGLDEPFRAALLLRYYENLAPREIAARLGIPVETARSRVRRGLERLRERLVAREDGRGHGGLAALAALPTGGAGLAPAIGGTVMAKKPVVAAALVVGVLATGTWLALAPEPDVTEEVRAPPVVAPSPEPVGAAALASVERPPSSSPSVGAAATAPASAPQVPIPPGMLRGRLVGLDPSLPGSAQVSVVGLLGDGNESGPAEVATASRDGGFLIDVAQLVRGPDWRVRPNALRVSVDHREYVPVTVFVPLGPPAPGLAEEVVVEMHRAAALVGRVVDSSGRALKEVVVALLGVDEDDPRTIDAIQAQWGVFRLRSPAAGEHLLVVVAPGFRPGWRRERLAVGTESDAGTIALERGASISGTARAPLLPRATLAVRAVARAAGPSLFVRDARGHTLADLRWEGDRLERRGAVARVDPSGEFVLTGLGRGIHRVEVEVAVAAPAPDASRRGPRPATPTEPPPRIHQDASRGSGRDVHAPETGVDLELGGSFLAIRARSRQRPLAGATVHVEAFPDADGFPSGASAQATDFDGRASLLVRPDARYVVRVAADGFETAERTVTAPRTGDRQDEPFLLEALDPPKRTLSVRLRTEKGEDAGVAKARFALVPDGASRSAWSKTIPAKDRAFVAVDPPAGRFRLAVVCSGTAVEGATPWLDAEQRVEVAEAGATTVDVRLALGGWLVLSAKGPDGRRLAARGRVLDEDGESRATSFVVRTGGGVIGRPDVLSAIGPATVEPPLPPGRYRVSVSHEGFADRVVEAEVRRGETTTLDVPLEPR